MTRGRSIQRRKSTRSAPWLYAVLALASFLLPQRAVAQDWGDLVKDIQQVSVSSYCWRWEEPLESRCTLGGGIGLEIGYAFRPLYEGKDFGVELNLGLGYTETNAFELRADSIRLTGVARERPALFICAAGGYRANAAVFVCGRTGLLDLHDTQAWDSTDVRAANSYSGGGSIFQIGGSVGVAVGYEPVLLTAQVSRMWRRFDTVTWEGEAQNTLPRALPRSLDLSGVGVTLGISFQVKNAERDTAATASRRALPKPLGIR
jgi:hypothetical protein